MPTDDLVGMGFLDEELRTPDQYVRTKHLFHRIEHPRIPRHLRDSGQQHFDIGPEVSGGMVRQFGFGHQMFKFLEGRTRGCGLFGGKNRQGKCITVFPICRGQIPGWGVFHDVGLLFEVPALN